MKKLIILTVAALSIAACTSSPNEMRSKTPSQVFSSQQDAKQVASCVAGKWETRVNRFSDWGVVKLEETATGYSVSALKYGPDLDDGSARKPTTVNYLVDVENKNSGSVSKLYLFLSLNLGANPFAAAVEECQG